MLRLSHIPARKDQGSLLAAHFTVGGIINICLLWNSSYIYWWEWLSIEFYICSKAHNSSRLWASQILYFVLL